MNEQKKGAYIGLPLTDIRFTNEEFVELMVSFRPNVVKTSFGVEAQDQLRDFLGQHLQTKKDGLKKFAEDLGKVAEEVLGVPSYIPHVHFDPKKHADATPKEVADAEVRQLIWWTSVLIVVLDDPATGIGIEMGHCNMKGEDGVPIVAVYRVKPSRLALGLKSLRATICYTSHDEAATQLRYELQELKTKKPWLFE